MFFIHDRSRFFITFFWIGSSLGFKRTERTKFDVTNRLPSIDPIYCLVITRADDGQSVNVSDVRRRARHSVLSIGKFLERLSVGLSDRLSGHVITSLVFNRHFSSNSSHSQFFFTVLSRLEVYFGCNLTVIWRQQSVARRMFSVSVPQAFFVKLTPFVSFSQGSLLKNESEIGLVASYRRQHLTSPTDDLIVIF